MNFISLNKLQPRDGLKKIKKQSLEFSTLRIITCIIQLSYLIMNESREKLINDMTFWFKTLDNCWLLVFRLPGKSHKSNCEKWTCGHVANLVSREYSIASDTTLPYSTISVWMVSTNLLSGSMARNKIEKKIRFSLHTKFIFSSFKNTNMLYTSKLKISILEIHNFPKSIARTKLSIVFQKSCFFQVFTL